MKYLFWFLLPLVGLILVIQIMVIGPLSGSSYKMGAVAKHKEVQEMPLYAASKKKTSPIQANQNNNRVDAGAEGQVEDFKNAVNQVFNDIRGSLKKTEPSQGAIVEQSVAAPSTFEAEVVKVYDGDTLNVDVRGTRTKIRLGAIDAPELKQEGGEEAKERLSSLILGKTVTVEPVDTDRYGRLIAFLSFNGHSVNELLVKDGWAWWYRVYAYNHNYYDDMLFAMKQKIGIWREPGALPPALFRKLYTLGQLGHNIIKNGLYLDDKGIMHNKNIMCRPHYPKGWRWNGLDTYENCPVCYGAIFAPKGVLGAYLNDASEEPYVEDSFEDTDVTDLEAESHLDDDEMFDDTPVVGKKKTGGQVVGEVKKADPYRGTTSNCPTCNSWGWYFPR